jgi:hypothetical protein
MAVQAKLFLSAGGEEKEAKELLERRKRNELSSKKIRCEMAPVHLTIF